MNLCPAFSLRHFPFSQDGTGTQREPHGRRCPRLMSATRSVNSWDLSIEIIDNEDHKLIFFDKRDDFDLLPVNEGGSWLSR